MPPRAAARTREKRSVSIATPGRPPLQAARPDIIKLPPLSPRWLPALSWLRSYQRKWLRADVIAGVTLAAYLLPAGIGDASLANLPPEVGLYACLFGGLIFWSFCGSRYTAVYITSAISLVIGSSLGEMTGGNTMRFGVLAAGPALLVLCIGS